MTFYEFYPMLADTFLMILFAIFSFLLVCFSPSWKVKWLCVCMHVLYPLFVLYTQPWYFKSEAKHNPDAPYDMFPFLIENLASLCLIALAIVEAIVLLIIRSDGEKKGDRKKDEEHPQ